jgi:hypothetical protein
MKKRIIIVLAMCVLAGQLITGAQTKDRERCHQDGTKEKPSFEEVSQRKAERMAMDLALDDATAKEFIELYKVRLQEHKALNEKYKGKKVAKGEKKPVYKTDAEVEKKIKDGFDRRQEKLDLDRKHYDQFRKVLGPKQIQKMYSIENQKKKAAPQKEAAKKSDGKGRKLVAVRPQPRIR